MSHVLEPALSVTRLRRQRVPDPYSGQDTLGAWEDADKAVITDCFLAPGSSDEFPNVELEQLHALATLYMPFGADVTATDRVVAAGALWDVQGRRADWPGRLTSGSTVVLKWVREEQ